MMIYTSFLLAALSMVTHVKGWKAAVLTDVHVDPGYMANITADSYCSVKSTGKVVYTEQLAPYGRIGCDPPIETIELIIKRLSEKE